MNGSRPQALLEDLSGDSGTQDIIDLRSQLRRAAERADRAEAELRGLQPTRERAAQAGVLAKRLDGAVAEVRALQAELAKRDGLLASVLERGAEARFALAAEAATSGEKAVVQLAAMDPTVDADRVLPASVPRPGALLCVRCERSLEAVVSAEADVRRAAALEKARPCKAFLQVGAPCPPSFLFGVWVCARPRTSRGAWWGGHVGQVPPDPSSAF